MLKSNNNYPGVFRFVLLPLVFLFFFLISSAQAKLGEGQMKKVIMLVSQNGFRDEELFVPRQILEKNGIEVKVSSTTLREVSGVAGGKVKPDILLSDVNPDDFDAVILVGGGASSQYWDDPVAHKLVREIDNKKRIVAAICIAPVTLARAGILKNKQATVWNSEAVEIQKEGADYIAKPVVKDGNIITASGPSAASEFGEEIVKALIH